MAQDDDIVEAASKETATFLHSLAKAPLPPTGKFAPLPHLWICSDGSCWDSREYARPGSEAPIVKTVTIRDRNLPMVAIRSVVRRALKH